MIKITIFNKANIEWFANKIPLKEIFDSYLTAGMVSMGVVKKVKTKPIIKSPTIIEEKTANAKIKWFRVFSVI